jgi:integrase
METLEEKYLEDQRDRGLTPMTLKSTRGNLGTIIRRLFVICGPLYPDEITKHHFREVRRNCPDIKDITLKNYLCKLGGMIKFGTGHDPYNEAAMLWSKSDVERTWIFKDQWKEMLAVANPAEKIILYLGAGLGLRREEIATIKLSDFKGNKVMVSGKGHGRGKLVEKEVPDSVLRAIEEYLPYREGIISQYGDRADGALIAIPYRAHSPTASIRFVEQTMRGLVEKSRIKATCHTLRRFYCTNLFDAGVEQDTVRRMMRHSHLDTTLNHYLYADPRKIKSATTAVDDALDL